MRVNSGRLEDLDLKEISEKWTGISDRVYKLLESRVKNKEYAN